MTHEEAMKVAVAASTADGGCKSCVRVVCATLNAAKLGWNFELSGCIEYEISNIDEHGNPIDFHAEYLRCGVTVEAV